MKYMISKELAEQDCKLLNEWKEKEKKVFSRGDFDEYKISDEELEECQKDIEKSYAHREFVRGNGKRKSYWRVRNYEGIEGRNKSRKSTVIKDVSGQKLIKLLEVYRGRQSIHLKNQIRDVVKHGDWKILKTKMGNTFKYDTSKSSKMIDETINREFEQARILVDRGMEVYLPSEPSKVKGKKNIDAIVNGVWVEFKYIDTGNRQTAANEYLNKLVKCPNVFMYISKKSKNSTQSCMNAILGRAKQSKNHVGILIMYDERSQRLIVRDLRNIKKIGGSKILKSSGAKVSYRNLDNSIIPDSTNKSTPKPAYNGQNVRNKSFIVGITDITENNKAKKVDQLEKALNAMYNRIPFGINHVPADDSSRYQDIEIHITDFSKEKIEKAVRTTAFSLGVPLKSGSGETFYFDSQKELTDMWCERLSMRVKAVYDFITDYFDLPEINVMSKANLKHKGKILYNPETGKPISTSEWNRFVTDLEKFLNRNKPAGEKIVLDAQALGRLLDKMLKTNSLESVRKMALKDIKVKEKSYEWVSDSVKHLNAVLGSELAGEQMARIEMLQRSAAQKVAGIDNAMKDNIKQILIDGVTNKKSKSQVSQDLFDKMVGHTRDFQRLADTEIQKNFNDAYIAGEINNTEPGENVYFQRVEVIDGNTCEYCKKMNGKIAVWSKTPLSSGKVSDKDADLAIWEGKEWDGKKLTAIPDAPVSIFHPWCRGVWLRYDPAVGKI